MTAWRGKGDGQRRGPRYAAGGGTGTPPPMSTSPTQSHVISTSEPDSAAAGRELGTEISRAFGGECPDAVILFLSPKYEALEVVRAVRAACRPGVLMGCSSAGEFTHTRHGEGQACAVALRSRSMKFAAGMGRGISSDRAAVARQMISGFRGGNGGSLPGYSSALVLTDALAGHADELLEELTLQTGGNYQFFGGGAGDDANFKKTLVFLEEEIASDAAVALEILSEKPVGIGVRHGWVPASEPMRVTESRGALLVSLNSERAVDVFERHATTTGQKLRRDEPVPFFLHNIIGIDTGNGYKLRVPLGVSEDGAVLCAAEIPPGSTVCIMSTDVEAARTAAAAATEEALSKIDGAAPQLALFFDCVATRLRMGRDFGYELDSLREVLGGTHFAGCNTYGQVARTEGQFNGFHNCTAVVCVIPG